MKRRRRREAAIEGIRNELQVRIAEAFASERLAPWRAARSTTQTSQAFWTMIVITHATDLSGFDRVLALKAGAWA